MNKKKYPVFFIYLHPDVLTERWSYLHPFFHPMTMKNDGKPMMVGMVSDNSFHPFLRATVRDFGDGNNEIVHIPYSIIETLIEIASAQVEKMGFDLTKRDDPRPE